LIDFGELQSDLWERCEIKEMFCVYFLRDWCGIRLSFQLSGVFWNLNFEYEALNSV
jgi:hypothetical protein